MCYSVFILNNSESVEVKLGLVVSVHLTSSVFWGFFFSRAVSISLFESRGQGQFFFLLRRN